MLATWVTFVPCILWLFLGAPFDESLRGNKLVAAALSAITAAVFGVVLNLAIWFAPHTIFLRVWRFAAYGLSPDVPVPASVNWPSLVLTLASVASLFRLKFGMGRTLAGAAAFGIIGHFIGGR